MGSLTVLPATLAWLGDRVEKGGVPIIKDQPWNAGESGAVGADPEPGPPSSRHLGRARRGAAGGPLDSCLQPPHGEPERQVAAAGPRGDPDLQRDPGGLPGRADPGRSVAVSAERRDLTRGEGRDRGPVARAAASADFKQPITTEVSSDRTVAQVDIPLAGDGSDSKSNAALAALRDDLIPATVGGLPGVTADVTGYTADSEDFTDTLKSHAPLVFGFVLTAAFLLLLFTFRSIVIPFKAIVLNLLSVGAAYGILVWIFQYGHLESLLGFKSTGSIMSWMPLFLFVVLFGLSMDYHVFILTRIREAFDRGMPTDEAVAHGIKTTAGVVTSAAVVMIAVFAIFATLSLLIFKELGVGLGGGGADRRDAHPRRAAAGDDEAARRLELVPAELAGVAAPPHPRARARAARAGRGRGGPARAAGEAGGRRGLACRLAVVDAMAELERGREAYSRRGLGGCVRVAVGRGPVRSARSRGPRAARHLRLHARSRGRVPRPPRARPSRPPRCRRAAARPCAALSGSASPSPVAGRSAARAAGSAAPSGCSTSRGTTTVSSAATCCCRSSSSRRRAATSRRPPRPPARPRRSAERFGDPDLFALAAHEQGHILIRLGRIKEGLRLLDETMVAVTAGELSPIVSGIVYCGVILACQDAHEVASRAGVDRRASRAGASASPTWSPSPAAASCIAPRSCSSRAPGRRRWRRRGGPRSAACRGRTRRQPARPVTGRARSTACSAISARPRRPTGRRAGAGGSRSRAWPCCGWRRARREPAAAAIRRVLAETAEPGKRAASAARLRGDHARGRRPRGGA